jgi:siderophore synthetase component
MYLFLSLMIFFGKSTLGYAAGADREDIPAAPARPLSPTTLAAQLAALQARLDEQQAQIAQQARHWRLRKKNWNAREGKLRMGRQRHPTPPAKAPLSEKRLSARHVGWSRM